MVKLSQKSESFAHLLAQWMERGGYESASVRGRTEAGRRLGLSHQTVANYLAGDLPASTRVAVLAAGLGVGARKLGAIIDRQRHAAAPSPEDAETQSVRP